MSLQGLFCFEVIASRGHKRGSSCLVRAGAVLVRDKVCTAAVLQRIEARTVSNVAVLDLRQDLRPYWGVVNALAVSSWQFCHGNSIAMVDIMLLRDNKSVVLIGRQQE